MERGGSYERKAILLPYEWQLCEQLGLSEEEYRWFKKEIANRTYVRPAEYGLVPEVQNGPVVPILINLAIGLALTAVSMLLAPSVPRPEELKNRENRTKRYSDINGRDRFAPVVGFDSIADVATLGDPVPLIWTRREKDFGGVVVEPKLVWSRIYSYGNTQVCKMLYVVGESDIGKPLLAGLWLGNNGINVMTDVDYAFYFGNNTGTLSLVYGSEGATGGNPTAGTFPNFSQCWTPSNNSTFGISNPVANGTDYRVNWRVISILSDGSKEAKAQARMDRKKICGYGSVEQGMKGIGMGYPRRLGYVGDGRFQIVSEYLDPNLFVVRDVGDDENIIRASVDDINKALDAECAAADDLFQIGEKFMSGSTVFQVTGRSKDIWIPNGGTQTITLKQIDTIGSFPAQAVTEGSIQNDKFIHINGENMHGGRGYGSGYYPFMRFDEARIKNSRPCDVTEIGIKSTVWGRVNGFCNVNDLPTPDQLRWMDRNNVQVSSGTMQTYFRRTCGFKIYSRGVGSSVWMDGGPVFLVSGATPQAQYNYVRMTHARGLYEFRLVPLNGAILQRLADAGQSAILLKATSSTITKFSLSVASGECRGVAVSIGDYRDEPLFWQNPGEQDDGTNRIPGSVSYVGLSGAEKASYGRRAAIMYEIFGDPANFGSAGTQYRVIACTRTSDNNKQPLTAQLLVWSSPINHKFESDGVTRRVWGDFRWAVWDLNRNLWPKESSGNSWLTGQEELGLWSDPDVESTRSTRWQVGMMLRFEVEITPQNPFHFSNITSNENMNSWMAESRYDTYNSRFMFSVDSLTSPPRYGDRELRKFEHYAQIADVSHYGSLIERSCDSGPEHEITYVNEIRNYQRSNNSLCMAGVVVRANRSFTSLDQLRMYITSGVNNSNSFPKLVEYMLSNAAVRGSRKLDSSMIDYGSLNSADSFCRGKGMYFDGVLADRQNLRSYIATMAPFFLLTLTIRNGKLGLHPAIPEGSSHQLFTAGNIVDGSLSVNMIDISQRRDFQAVMVYRVNQLNQLPETRSVRLAYDTNAPMEQFDMSSYCTNVEHAKLAGRFMLAVRKHITKQITFQTTPDQARFGPGDLVSVSLDTAIVRSMETGTVLEDGTINSPVTMADGAVPVVFWRPGMDDVEQGTMTVVNGHAQEELMRGAMFALRSSTVTTTRMMVETVNLTEDGLVEVSGTDFPEAIASDVYGGGSIGVYE